MLLRHRLLRTSHSNSRIALRRAVKPSFHPPKTLRAWPVVHSSTPIQRWASGFGADIQTGVSLTPAAIAVRPSQKQNHTVYVNSTRRVREIREQDPIKFLRIIVNSGGCNGYLTSFSLEPGPMKPDDVKVFDRDGAIVVLDQISASLLEGATIDYESSIARSAFKIAENPHATSECGCKVSFGVD